MYQDAEEVYEWLDLDIHGEAPKPFLLKRLFQEDPSTARQEFDNGRTLLHQCMEYYADRLDLVSIFAEAYPESVTIADGDGFLPLHLALLSESATPGLDVIRFLAEKAPDTLSQVTPMGHFPLNMACNRPSSVTVTTDVFQYLIDAYPDALHCRDEEDKFPLVTALEMDNPPTEVIQLLVQQSPIVLSLLVDGGSLPLHWILGRRNHTKKCDQAVDILVQNGPTALQIQDLRHGQTPLLMACQNDNSLSQIYSLVRKWPEQVDISTFIPTLVFGSLPKNPGFNGELLPSSLAYKSITLQHLKAWLLSYPYVLWTGDVLGRFPLHYAAISPSDDADDMVAYLLEQAVLYTAETSSNHILHTLLAQSQANNAAVLACSLPDHHGRLPLHYAAAKPNNTKVLELLLAVYPTALSMADKSGRLPWHYAKFSHQDWIQDVTAEWDPELPMDNDNNLIPEKIYWDVIGISSGYF